AHAARPAVFCRLAGCNLWSWREEDRATAVCTFCDTDIAGTNGHSGGKHRVYEELAVGVERTSTSRANKVRHVVSTSGEMHLQLDAPLIAAFHARGFEIAIETNGTIAAPEGIDWICVSPKADAALVQTRGDELKLVYPQEEAMPERFEVLEFRHFFLQPMDGP